VKLIAQIARFRGVEAKHRAEANGAAGKEK
jgi:hypothetical protein